MAAKLSSKTKQTIVWESSSSPQLRYNNTTSKNRMCVCYVMASLGGERKNETQF